MSVKKQKVSQLVHGIPEHVVEVQDLVILKLASEVATTQRNLWVQGARVFVACAVTAAAGYAITQENCFVDLCHHVCKHAVAGALFAAYRLWERAGKHDPNLKDSFSEFRKDVVHSVKEGVLFGIATAILDML